MSQTVQGKEGPAIGTLHEVRATFSNPEAMQDAVTRLEMSGFDRADLSLPDTPRTVIPTWQHARSIPKRMRVRRGRSTPAEPLPPSAWLRRES